MQDAYEDALALVLKKLRAADRFESEVRGWLADYPNDVSERVVAFLHEHRMLNDQRAARAVADKNAHKGRLALEHELQRRGVAAETIEAVLPDDEVERARVRELLTKRFAQDDDPRKAARFLLSRGFQEDTVRESVERYFESGRDD
jgi:SOS response regulatory protein OraA/RecX